MNLEQLYSAMALRQRVFVVEQECPYLDADGIDAHCLHVLGMQSDVLVAYARILPPGLGHVHPCIGRVVTAPEIRGTGAGKDLMRFAIASVGTLYGPCTVHISAQSYLERFYRQLGFLATGHEYLEDNIPHMAMELILE
jgi:ElaA protein